MEHYITTTMTVLPGAYRKVMPGTSLRNTIKRVFDLIFSLLVILLLFPWLFPLLCLLIRLDSKGSIFFVQKRQGRNNKVFNCFKFRTMIPTGGSVHTSDEGEERVTRVGRVLRVSGLDELPQFLNVLMGQMSIVGPRPHMIGDNLKFERMDNRYQARSKVKPGITGLAQVKGCKGNAHDAWSIRKRTAFDITYVEKYNLLLDLRIVAATAGLMFSELFKLAKRR